jgi:hypothetical protein
VQQSETHLLISNLISK